jgi:hypothetical protein
MDFHIKTDTAAFVCRMIVVRVVSA